MNKEAAIIEKYAFVFDVTETIEEIVENLIMHINDDLGGGQDLLNEIYENEEMILDIFESSFIKSS